MLNPYSDTNMEIFIPGVQDHIVVMSAIRTIYTHTKNTEAKANALCAVTLTIALIAVRSIPTSM